MIPESPEETPTALNYYFLFFTSNITLITLRSKLIFMVQVSRKSIRGDKSYYVIPCLLIEGINRSRMGGFYDHQVDSNIGIAIVKWNRIILFDWFQILLRLNQFKIFKVATIIPEQDIIFHVPRLKLNTTRARVVWTSQNCWLFFLKIDICLLAPCSHHKGQCADLIMIFLSPKSYYL